MTLLDFVENYRQELWRELSHSWVVQIQANGFQPYLIAVEPGNETHHHVGALQLRSDGKIVGFKPAPMAPHVLAEIARKVLVVER